MRTLIRLLPLTLILLHAGCSSSSSVKGGSEDGGLDAAQGEEGGEGGENTPGNGGDVDGGSDDGGTSVTLPDGTEVEIDDEGNITLPDGTEIV